MGVPGGSGREQPLEETAEHKPFWGWRACASVCHVHLSMPSRLGTEVLLSFFLYIMRETALPHFFNGYLISTFIYSFKFEPRSGEVAQELETFAAGLSSIFKISHGVRKELTYVI